MSVTLKRNSVSFVPTLLTDIRDYSYKVLSSDRVSSYLVCSRKEIRGLPLSVTRPLTIITILPLRDSPITRLSFITSYVPLVPLPEIHLEFSYSSSISYLPLRNPSIRSLFTGLSSLVPYKLLVILLLIPVSSVHIPSSYSLHTLVRIETHLST